MPKRFGPRLTCLFLALSLASFGAWLAFHSTAGATPQSSEPGRPGGADSLEQKFSTQVQPFFERYCFECHGSKKRKADLDLSRDFTVTAIAGNLRPWDLVRARLQEKEMPPEEAARQPKADERAAAIAWLRDLGD